MSEALFYHLERQGLESVLPGLLQKTLARGWRALVRAGNAERVAALDAHLWTFDAAAFLPHGTAADGHAARQPVYLTAGDENPNAAEVLFLVDGAAPGDWPALAAGFARIVLLFDGLDEGARSAARREWANAKAAGHAVTYWRQTPDGKWEKQA